jgi:hypothetical protein
MPRLNERSRRDLRDYSIWAASLRWWVAESAIRTGRGNVTESSEFDRAPAAWWCRVINVRDIPDRSREDSPDIMRLGALADLAADSDARFAAP